MGHYTARKFVFVSTLAAAAMSLMLAASDSFALEATEIGPGPAGQGVSPAVASKGEGPWAKAGSTLRRVFAAHSAHQQAGADAPFKPDNPSVQFAQGLILIDAVASSDGAALLEELRALGLKGGTQYGAVVSGRIPLGRLGQVVGLGSLRGVSASLKPETNSAVDPTFGLVHDRSAAIAMSLIATDADPQTYTGAGIKVGVLSDTFDNNGNPDYDGNGVGEPPATNAADDLVNGDLPGGGAFVALHAPGDVDDDDKSAFAAIGTNGPTAAATDTNKLNNLAGNFHFTPANGPDENPSESFISWPDAPQYTIGLQPFTIEMWVNFDAIDLATPGDGPILASQYTASGNQSSWLIAVVESTANFPGLKFAAYVPGTGTANQVAIPLAEFTPVTNNWYHIAVSRDEVDQLRIFVNGLQHASVNFPYEVFDVTAPLRLGMFDSSAGGNRHLEGSIEDFRFVVGEALYTANFTPPGPLASELPGAGPTASTNVVDDTASPGIDEGRAMAQLIHDVAPDASVSFHTAFNGMADFAQGIQDLADDGADVIVDDIIYFAEPMFQDGIIAQAVDTVVSQGIPYFSSASNSARKSYESPFVASGERLTVNGIGGPEERGMLHDFDPTAGIDYMQSVTIPAGATFTLVTQWDQPFASTCGGCPGAANDVDIYLVDGNLNILTSSISDNLSTGEPVEILQLTNPGPGTSFHIMMAHYDVKTPQHPKPGSPPTLMKSVWFASSSVTVNEYNTNSAASYGHANADGAAAVGAAYYLDTPAYGQTPPLLESFSSAGGTPILFDTSGNALGVSDLREKPEFVAPDGTNTTFFFRDTSTDDADEFPESFPNFFGTSAAAPHAAAIAALMLEANPALTPGDIYSILESTAIDMGPGGFDFDTGYGLINATAAIAQATGGNLVPIANDDNAATDQNTLISIPVLTNDAPGDPITVVTIESAAADGTAVPNGNGTDVDYTPDLDYFGPDSFQYRITDNNGEFSIATVNVTVNEVDVLPNAVIDNAATNEDTPVNIDVMSNDDPLGNLPTTITAAGPGMLGSTVTIAPDGSDITYEPAPNFFNNDSFPYTITDADGDTSNAMVTVSVNPVNDPPVAVNDLLVRDEDTSADFDDAFMLNGDTDPENNPLSIFVVDLKSSQQGDVDNHGNGTYTYTPPANFNGNDAIGYTVSDGNGGTDTASIAITVNAVNDPPVAANDSGSTNQNTPVTTANVLTNDTDVDGDTLSVQSADGISANGGSVTNNNDGTFDYTPAANFTGADSFEYVVSDGNGGSDTATVNVTVNAIANDAPVAVDDVAVVSEDSDANPIDVRFNDSDPDGDSLTVSAVTQSANGTVVNGGTDVTYTPNANFSGDDSFTYTVSDGNGGTDTATVNVTVSPANDAPVAGDDAAVVSEDSGANPIDVRGNDSDPDGDTLSVSAITQGANGAVAITNGGADVTYTPDGGFFGNDSFTYTVSDGNGGSDTATVDITVNAVNDDPVATNDNDTTNEDVAVVIDVRGNDSDADGDTLSVTGITQGANGSVANNGTDVTYTPNADFNGPDSFTYTVSDGNGGSDIGTVNVTVNAVNDDPIAIADPGYVTNEDTALNEAAPGVLGNDTDVDGDSLTAVINSGVSNGNLTLNPDGSFSYTPNTGFSGQDSFTYNANDGTANSAAAATVTINVNALPSTVHLGNISGSSTSAPRNRWQATATVVVHDAGHTAIGIGALVEGNWSNGTNGGGSCTTDQFGSCSITKGSLKSGVSSVTFSVTNITFDNDTYANGDNDTGSTVQIGQPGSNTNPVASNDSDTTNEDNAVVIDVLADDSDPDGDSLTVSSVTQGANGSVANNGANVTYTPNVNFNGADSFTYTISDGNGGNDTATVDVTVNAINDDPVAATDNDTTNEEVAVVIDVLANDNDLDGDGLTVSGVTQGANGSVANNGANVTYTPNVNFNGADSFTYTISDGNGGNDTATVNVTVNAAGNASPVANGDGDTTDEDVAVVINVLGNDTDGDGDTLTVSGVTQGANGSVANNGANVTYTPNANFNGADNFTYTISDGNGGSDTATVDVTVNAINDDPVAANDNDTTDESDAVVIDVLTNDNDLDGDGLSISGVAQGLNGSVTNNGTNVTYMPNTNFVGLDTFTYTVSDGNGGSDTATVDVTVNAVSAITLSATGYKVKGVQHADLTWGAATVDVYRDGALIDANATNPYTNNIGSKGGGSYVYQVCEIDGGPCSNTVNVVF